MATFDLFSYAGESVENAARVATSGVAGQTIAICAGVAVGMVTVYYMIMGYLIMSGTVQSPFVDFVKSGVKFALIAMFSLSAVGFNKWIPDTVYSVESMFTSAWSDGKSKNAYEVLDNTFEKLANKAVKLTEKSAKASWYEIGDVLSYYLMALFIFVAAALVTLPAAAMIMAAKIFLIILVAIAPFFIFSLMFPLTSKYFDAWLGNVMTQIFTIALIGLVLTIASEVCLNYVAQYDMKTVGHIETVIKILVIGALMMWIMFRTGNLAGHLAGGVSSSAITLIGAAAAAAGAAIGVASAANKLDKGKTDRDGNSIKGRKSQRAAKAAKSGVTYAYRAGMAKMQAMRARNTIKPA